MCALRHLTSRHEEEEKARSEFVTQLGGHIPVAHVLHAATAGVCPELGLVCQPPHNPLTSWTLVKAVVGLLRNLSMNVDNHRPMLEAGIVAGLSVLLYATQYEISKVSSHFEGILSVYFICAMAFGIIILNHALCFTCRLR